jgi:cytochrome P450
VRERRAAPERPGEVRDDLLHRLMGARDPETGQSMNDEQLVDNLLTFYLAGHETTAKALTWTLYLLARSPQWTALLEDEIARVTGGGAVTAAHIDRLLLVQQVIKESMRIYPPVPLMSRQAVAETKLDGHTVKVGTSLVMPIYAIHRHRKRWEDPDAFDPGRFAPDREAKNSALPVHAVRRGPADLHRQRVRDDRGHGDARHDAATRALLRRKKATSRNRSHGSRCCRAAACR